MSEPLEDIQDRILERLHAGEPVEPEEFLAAHPEHSEALRAFFEVVTLIEEPPLEREPLPTRLGEFRILRELGRGGMGVVYEAEQPSLKRKVALKVLPPALRRDKALLARFRREAEAAARLRHPNVVPVFSIGDAGDAPFFAMELVEGRSLAEVIDARLEGDPAKLPEDADQYWRVCVAIAAKIATALSYAHGQGILHRDVKPGNILLEEDGTPRLTDFGLALDLEASSLTVSGEVFGSPRYMSPEQAFRKEKPLDARTDIYSLGVTLYELLTLHLPYEGTTTDEVLTALHQGVVIPPRKVNPALPVAVERVLLKALSSKPEDRYATAADFAEDLRTCASGKAVALPPRRRWGRRLLVVAPTLVVLVFLGPALLDSLIPDRLTPGPANFLPDPEVIQAIADGRQPEGAQILERWFDIQPSFRQIVVRSVPATFRVEVGYSPSYSWSGVEQIAAVCVLEYSLDGGPWQRPPLCGVELARFGGGSREGVKGGLFSFIPYDVRDILGDAISKQRVTLAHRLTLRMFRIAEGQEIRHGRPLSGTDDEYPFDATEGTVATWAWDPETVLLFDDFPADYPEAVSDAETDEAMTAAYTPDRVENLSLSDNGTSLSMRLIFFGSRPGPLPIASEITVHRPGSDAVIATADFKYFDDTEGLTNLDVGVRFPLDETLSEEQQRFFLDLSAGVLERVRLVFRPSVRVARETGFSGRMPWNDLARYWGGTLDVTVPVRR